MRYILLVYFLLTVQFSFAQSLDLSEYSINTYKTYFKKESSSVSFWNEIPPWTIKGDLHQYFFTTNFTTMWSTSASIANPKDNYLFVGASHGSRPAKVVSSSHWWGDFYDPKFLGSSQYEYKHEWENHQWRRNYNGVFSAHLINLASSKQNILFAISHGENKNEKIGKHLYQNTVRPDFIIDKNNPATYSGGNPYTDCWDAYFGFLNGNWMTYAELGEGSYLNDLGPIAWPSAGYLKPNASQASKGLRHPSSIVHENYLYIYVIDESMDGTGGVKLIRSHLNNVLNPNAYETRSKDKWVPSLPKGFSRDNSSDFFNKRGPENTPVFASNNNTIRFSVAKIKDNEKFIGVEEYISGGNDNTIKVAFRMSDDLINWSDRSEFYASEDWSNSNLRYPIFLNTDGTSNTEVDLEEFYILGSSASGVITKYHFKHAVPALSMIELPDGNLADRIKNSSLATSTRNAAFTVHPVPATYTIDVKININSASVVGVTLYDANGAKIRRLLNEVIAPQFMTKTFDVSDLKAGIYLVELIYEDERQYQRIVKL